MKSIGKISKATLELTGKYSKRIDKLARDLAKDFVALMEENKVKLYKREGKEYTNTSEFCLILRSWDSLTESRFGLSLSFAIQKEIRKKINEQLKKKKES